MRKPRKDFISGWHCVDLICRFFPNFSSFAPHCDEFLSSCWVDTNGAIKILLCQPSFNSNCNSLTENA